MLRRHNNMGNTFKSQGQSDEAIASFSSHQITRRLRPSHFNFFFFFYFLCTALKSKGKN